MGCVFLIARCNFALRYDFATHDVNHATSGLDHRDQARKRHININFLVRLLLGHPGNVHGTNQVCPRDKVGLSQGQTQVFFLVYTAEAQFVPGTFRGRRAADRVYVFKVYVLFSFPNRDQLHYTHLLILLQLITQTFHLH